MFLLGRHKHNRNSYDNVYYPQLSALNYDYLGNCYVESENLKGHCVRYQECESAVKAWQKYQKFPTSCYYTAYENVVCCPEAYIKPKQRTTTLPPQTVPYYNYYHNNPFLSRAYSNQRQQERLSDQQCSSIYNNPQNVYYRRKRDLNENIQPLEPVQEETVKKVKVTETQVVGGKRTEPNEFPYMVSVQKSVRKLNSCFIFCVKTVP